MSTELYNEGRVVGYSAYEIYVKQALTSDPPIQPASEKEWLAASIANGSSMLLYVYTDGISGLHYREISLPSTTKLCAANTIMGNFFEGSGHLPEGTIWADRVDDYGDLISNTSTSSPNGVNISDIPTKTIETWSNTKKNQIKNYINIIDGVVLQPGTWAAGNQPPEKDLTPDLSKIPAIRLLLKDKIDTAFWLLLTGFTIKSVIQGTSGLDGSTNTQSPKDGDFLGPAVYPWANKIIFSAPNAYLKYFVPQIDMETLVEDTPYVLIDDSAKKLVAGGDIALETTDSEVKIHNTAPDASMITYKILEKGTDYDIIPFNAIRCGGAHYDESTSEENQYQYDNDLNIWVYQYSEFDRIVEVGQNSTGSVYYIKISGSMNDRTPSNMTGQTVLYPIQPSYDAGNTSIETGEDEDTLAPNVTWSNFRLTHTSDVSSETGVRSWLFAIKFIGEYAHLNSAHALGGYAAQIRTVSSPGSNLWNMQDAESHAYGGSFTMVEGIGKMPVWERCGPSVEGTRFYDVPWIDDNGIVHRAVNVYTFANILGIEFPIPKRLFAVDSGNKQELDMFPCEYTVNYGFGNDVSDYSGDDVSNPGYLPDYVGGYLIRAVSYSDGWNTQINKGNTSASYRYPWPQAKRSSNLNFTTMFTLTQKNITNIEIIQNPTLTEYAPLEWIDTAGLKLRVTYETGNPVDILNGFVCSTTSGSGFTGNPLLTKTTDLAQPQPIYVIYGKETFFNITINKSINSVSIYTTNSLSYHVGDTLDMSHLSLTVQYSDGSTRNVDRGFSCSPMMLNTAGEQTITVRYGGKTDIFGVTVSN